MSVKKLLTVLAVVSFVSAGLMYYGCATTDNMTHSQKMAAAKKIARDAGYYVASNNPRVAAAVTAGWEDIQLMTGDGFNEAFLDGLGWYLDQQGIAGSDRLIADARDLLALFGFDLDTVINSEFLNRVSIDVVKEVVQAFVDGMGYAE